MIGTRLMLAAAGALALVLAGCDNGPSAVSQKPATTQERVASVSEPVATRDGDDAPRVDHRDEPAKMVDGQAMWAASRRYSAEEGARRAFARNGEDFGARSVDQYVKAAHDFVRRPPKGVLTLDRPNGDTLFYDAKANIFAVANRDGAPKAMFKPDDGMAYWEEQQARQPSRRQTSARRTRNADDGA